MEFGAFQIRNFPSSYFCWGKRFRTPEESNQMTVVTFAWGFRGFGCMMLNINKHSHRKKTKNTFIQFWMVFTGKDGDFPWLCYIVFRRVLKSKILHFAQHVRWVILLTMLEIKKTYGLKSWIDCEECFFCWIAFPKSPIPCRMYTCTACVSPCFSWNYGYEKVTNFETMESNSCRFFFPEQFGD